MSERTSTPPVVRVDASLDRYARMVTRYLGVATSVVVLADGDRHVFPADEIRSAALSGSLCAAVVAEQTPVVTSDSRGDDRLRGEALGAIAYAAWPLIDERGGVVGALCAIDHRPREWTREELDVLSDLADACSAELVYRNRQQQAEAVSAHAREISYRSRVLLALSEGLSVTRTLDDVAYAVDQVAVEHLGCLHGGIWLESSFVGDHDHPDELRFVRSPSVQWESAARHGDLRLDVDHPIAQVMRDARPLFFDSRAEQNERYPHLDVSAQIGEARAIVPLALGHTIGVLVILWPRTGPTSAESRVTLAALASYVAQAAQRAVLFQERIHASVTLQSAMLSHLPELTGMDLTARYRPAEVHDRVGGDWYDAVVTARGEAVLTIGDVAGHDISAAAVMGELRSTLRAFAWAHEESPAAHVARLDEAMASFEVDRFASLVTLRVGDPDDRGVRTLEWTNAGHFPPLLVLPDGTVELLDDGAPPDSLVGIDPTTPRHDQRADVARGSLLLLYTDGLVERRDETIDEGLARLCAAAADHADLSPGRFLDEVIGDLVGTSHEDDVALLAVRFL